MERGIDLKKIEKALFEGNSAVKKRAIALIFQEGIVEAKPLLERVLLSETDQNIKIMTNHVIKSLISFEKESKQVDFQKVALLFESADPSHHLLGLRALLNRRSPEIPKIINEHFSDEITPDAAMLIIQILKNNPSLLNLEILIKLSHSPSEDIKCEAFDALINIFQACFLPNLFYALVDPSQRLKMKAYQFLGQLSRNHFLESLKFMFQSENPEITRLAGRLLMPFIGKDMINLLKEHITHYDEETATYCHNALLFLAQKEDPEAIAILRSIDKDNKTKFYEEEKCDRIELQENFISIVNSFPTWLIGQPLDSIIESLRQKNFGTVRFLFERLRVFLNSFFVAAYFKYGERNSWIDQTCFRILQQGTHRGNTINLLRCIAPSLPPPESNQDLFPFILAAKLRNDVDDQILEQFLSFEEAFKLIAIDSNKVEELFQTAIEGLERLLIWLSPIFENKLAVKIQIGEMCKVYDFFSDSPVNIDERLLTNFDVSVQRPLLISGNFTNALEVYPFVVFDPNKSTLHFNDPNEQEISEFLQRYDSLEIYLKSLVEMYIYQEP